MTTKLSANSAFLSAALIAFLGIVARRLGFPWISETLAFFKLPGVEINWDGVWLIILITSIIFLIGANFNAVKRWNNKRIEQKTRHWNMNFCDAVHYLSNVALFGAAWPDRDKSAAAATALYEAAHNGTIEIAGQLRTSRSLTKIPAAWFSSIAVLDLSHCTPYEEKNAMLLERGKKTVIYSSLTVDRDQIQRAWPTNGQRW
jgi:hypothetical protein